MNSKAVKQMIELHVTGFTEFGRLIMKVADME
jgi:hypothetical protein